MPNQPTADLATRPPRDITAPATGPKTCIGFDFADKQFCDFHRATHWGRR
jgi:hypothetical protein